MLGAGAGAGAAHAGAVSWLCAWWRQQPVSGAGPGAVSWLCTWWTWWRQVAGAGAGAGCRCWCWCWVPVLVLVVWLACVRGSIFGSFSQIAKLFVLDTAWPWASEAYTGFAVCARTFVRIILYAQDYRSADRCCKRAAKSILLGLGPMTLTGFAICAHTFVRINLYAQDHTLLFPK